MTDRDVFEYAALRAVPRVERAEFINVGVILYCQQRDFLAARTYVDADRLRAIDGGADAAMVRAAVDAVVRVCIGGPGTGPAGDSPPGRGFGGLPSPRSTIGRGGRVHAGLPGAPADELDRLFAQLVE